MTSIYTYNCKFQLRDEDDVVYNVEAKARIERDYSPDVPYLKNGDPGYPGWDDYEIIELEYTLTDENGQQLLHTEEWEDKVQDFILEDTDNWDLIER